MAKTETITNEKQQTWLGIYKLDFLIALYVACVALAELMGSKSFPLFNIGTFKLSATVAIFVMPLIYSANDVIVEVFGKEKARSIVRSTLFMVAFFMLFAVFATKLPPTARFASMNSAYNAVFGLSARISAASLVAFALGEFMDIYVFSTLKKKYGNTKLWLRTNLSNFISEGLDTFVFMTLAFYVLGKTPIENFSFLFGLMLPYWLLKCFMSVIETPFVYLGVHWFKRENEN
jgi:uncharacterized integral membrane protein (TIGR00697 family)